MLPQKRISILCFFLIDDHTCYCWIYLIKHRSKFFELYTVFYAPVKTQHSTIIKYLGVIWVGNIPLINFMNCLP